MKINDKLLSRDEFRKNVLNRDNNKCVICGNKANNNIKLDAHHILERRLWTESHQLGGYFLNNGVTLCDHNNKDYSCHIKASMTLISPDECRKAAGIQKTILPDHLYEDQIYTVWGDPILPNGRRLKGELFWDDGVQKMLQLSGIINLYTDYVKHPRTYHLPFSPKAIIHDLGDDRVMADLDRFIGKRVIVTEKMDGGQSTFYYDNLHLRSIDFKSDVTTHWLQNFHSKFCYEIPRGYRINIENLYVKHDILYKNIPSYIMAWMMWNDKNNCLSWDETLEWFELFDDILKSNGTSGLPVVPILYDGKWDENLIKNLYTEMYNGDLMEGFVVRLADQFAYKDFKNCVGKYVRANHAPNHAMRFNKILIRNEIKS